MRVCRSAISYSSIRDHLNSSIGENRFFRIKMHFERKINLLKQNFIIIFNRLRVSLQFHQRHGIVMYFKAGIILNNIAAIK